MFAVGDANADGKIYEGNDYYYLVDIRADKSVGVEKNNRTWGDWYIESAENSVTTADDGTATLEITFDPETHTITVAQGENVILSYTDYSAMPFTTTYYAIASKQTAGAEYTVSEVIPPVEFKLNKTKATFGGKDIAFTATDTITGVDTDVQVPEGGIVIDGTKITFKKAFLETLEPGSYTFIVNGDNGEVEVTIKINAPVQSGDSAAIVLVLVAVISLAGVAVASKKRAFQK